MAAKPKRRWHGTLVVFPYVYRFLPSFSLVVGLFDFLVLQADVRHMTSHVFRKEAVTDLGRPQTPRKEGNGLVGVEPTPNMSTLGYGSDAAAPIFDGGGQRSQKTNAPMADSVLSSIGASTSVSQAFALNSVLINVGGQVAAKVKLTDVRKQLMTMGLFPPDLYGVGESFEEMRWRYVILDISNQKGRLRDLCSRAIDV